MTQSLSSRCQVDTATHVADFLTEAVELVDKKCRNDGLNLSAEDKIMALIVTLIRTVDKAEKDPRLTADQGIMLRAQVMNEMDFRLSKPFIAPGGVEVPREKG